MSDRIVTSTTTTSSGMTVEKSFTNCSTGALKYRKCIFPQGHHMKETYGLDSLELSKSKNLYSMKLRGNILGQELFAFHQALSSPQEVRDMLKSLKNVKKMSLNDVVKDLLRVGRMVKL